jgi:hypothetical protein
MKHTDIQKLHDTDSITGARPGGSRSWRIEHLTAQRGHSVHNNDDPKEI